VTDSSETPEGLFTAWLREHRGILFKVARSFASDPATEGDLMQEMMLQLWRSLPRFAGGAKPSTWIYRVCLNTAMTWRRTEQRREQRVSPLAELPEVACPAPRPADVQENAEVLAALYDAIRALPAAERSLVLLLLDGLSYRDIAEITGLTESHVGVALTRVRKKLAEAMKEVRREY
jgi:RNA polymerase sigma-70 factor (ECF subfamily)